LTLGTSTAKKAFVSSERLQQLSLFLRLTAFALALCIASVHTFGSEIPPNPLAITSITLEGTNLILTADVPPNSGQVTLEMRPSLNAAWQDEETSSVQAGADEVIFTLPKPTNDICFFRLKSTPLSGNTSQVSDELQYATMPSLGSNVSRSGDAIFHFKGQVDGSDKIVITHDGALWSHVNWRWPLGSVVINDARWNPEQKNYMTTLGTSKFLPDSFSLESASLEKIEGRDVIAMERSTNALIVYLDDTPPGASEYEFTVHFHPVASDPVQTTGGVAADLKIAAQIDGSDCLKITSREAIWTHNTAALPTDVTLNDVPWDLESTNVLENEGTNTFLPSGVDLSAAKIVSRKGRDLATMWADKDGLWVWFADNPNGSDSYELDISFGR
jgi:hypothetical protein